MEIEWKKPMGLSIKDHDWAAHGGPCRPAARQVTHRGTEAESKRNDLRKGLSREAPLCSRVHDRRAVSQDNLKKWHGFERNQSANSSMVTAEPIWEPSLRLRRCFCFMTRVSTVRPAETKYSPVCAPFARECAARAEQTVNLFARCR